VRLDRNQRQSRIEERMLERNAAHLGGNAQSRGRGSYRGREGKVIWRIEGGYRRGAGGNTFNRRRTQMGPRRDLNAMDIDRERGENRTYYVYRKWGHIAKNCWERHKGRIVEILQESVKENGGQ